MSQYFKGTPKDFAEKILEHFPESVTNYDFLAADLSALQEDPGDLEYVADCSEGWYGIKEIPSLFDSDEIQLVSDYYGGGCAGFLSLDPEDGKEQAVQQVADLIIETMCMESCTKDTILIGNPNTEKNITEEKNESNKIQCPFGRK